MRAGAWALDFCLLSLVFDNAVLAVGRLLSVLDKLTWLTWLTKARLILHAMCNFLVLLPVAAIAWDNSLVKSKRTAPWLIACVSATLLSLFDWVRYDRTKLRLVRTEDPVAQRRGVVRYTSGEFVKLVLPSILSSLCILLVGVLSIARGCMPSGSLCVLGALCMLGCAFFRVGAMDAYGETILYACIAAALVVNHTKVLLADDVVCSHWVHEKLVWPPP